ncbi:winged helix-turn-helix domain-containing protein [Aeromonas hydrophila]|uniref:winged helix-turn-helix domain-containing protein n=1 Tax=Aeromonas hydrophila TaxID=644 RepID=UPI002ED492C6|nr:winged helix-turn-helix domain-containing protein [Aeromonas hydrophila]
MKRKFIIAGEITFEPDAFRIIYNGRELTLSNKEAALLCYLCENSMKVVPRAELIDSIWGGSESSDVGLNKTILMIRRKFESIGILNGINTISRVGYMLRLEVNVLQDASNHSHLPSKPHDDEELFNLSELGRQSSGAETLDNTTNPDRRVRRYYIFSCCQYLPMPARVGLLFSLIAFVTAMAYYYNVKYHEHTFRDMVHKKIENGNVLYTKDIENLPSLANSIKNLHDQTYWMMVSKNAVSYIHMSDSKPEWQKLFFIGGQRSLTEQMQCIVEHINDAVVDFATVTKPVRGMDYIRSYIYSPCESKKGGEGLGELFIRYTQFPDKAGIMIQNVSFINMDQQTVFKFKKVSEYHADFTKMSYAEYNRTKKVKHVKMKSVMFSELNQRLLQSNPLYARVLEELTTDDKYILTLDNEHKINADSTFQGMLYFDNIYNESIWGLN